MKEKLKKKKGFSLYFLVVSVCILLALLMPVFCVVTAVFFHTHDNPPMTVMFALMTILTGMVIWMPIIDNLRFRGSKYAKRNR